MIQDIVCFTALALVVILGFRILGLLKKIKKDEFYVKKGREYIKNFSGGGGLLNYHLQESRKHEKFRKAREFFKLPGVLKGIPKDQLDSFVSRIIINC